MSITGNNRIRDINMNIPSISNERKLLAFLLCAVSVGLLFRLFPYLFNSFFFEVGFDTGIYERIVRDMLSADSWPNLPAGFGEVSYRWAEDDPAFYLLTSWLVLFSGMDVNIAFRWVWPIFFTIVFSILVYIAATNISGSNSVGVISTFLFAFSYVQTYSMMESLWKQIVASMLLLMGFVFFDQFINKQSWRSISIALLMFVSTILYHSAFIAVLSITLAIIVLYLVYQQNYKVLKMLVIASIPIFAILVPIILSRQDILISLYDGFIVYSIQGLTSFFHGGSNHAVGGGMGGLLGGDTHVTILYVLLFPVTVIAAFVSIKCLGKGREKPVIYILLLTLFFYCFFWLYFANRLVITFDLIVCVMAPVGLYLLFRPLLDKGPRKKPGGIKKVLTVLGVSLIIISTLNGAYHQSQYEPYITDADFIQWFEAEADKDNYAFVGNDRISTVLQQKGIAVSLSSYPYSHYVDFQILAPGDRDYVERYLDFSSFTHGKELLVIFTSFDYEINQGFDVDQLIQAYRESSFFQEQFTGSGQVKAVFKYVG